MNTNEAAAIRKIAKGLMTLHAMKKADAREAAVMHAIELNELADGQATTTDEMPERQSFQERAVAKS